MANTDRPNGFIPVKSQLGAPWSALIRRYEAADRSSDTTNNHGDIYIGDPVKFSSGKLAPANSGDTVAGVVVGIENTSSASKPHFGMVMADPGNLGRQYLPLADSGYVYIVPAAGVLFEVQSASDLDLVVGDTADTTLVADTAHGSQTTGRSSVELTTSSDADVEVVQLQTAPDNDTTLANARYIVKFTAVAFDIS